MIATVKTFFGLVVLVLLGQNCFAEVDERLLQKRAEDYKNFIEGCKQCPKDERVAKINSYFNNFKKEHDAYIWQKEDYWANLEEFVAKGIGDAEDFAIAKYFALRESGFSEDELFLTIVQPQDAKGNHIIVSYLKDNKIEDPLVLDSVSHKILPLSKRSDLKEICCFNEKTFKFKNTKYDLKEQKFSNLKLLQQWNMFLDKNLKR